MTSSDSYYIFTQVSYTISLRCATEFSAIQKFSQSCFRLQLFFNKFLIEREDLENQYRSHYPNDHASINANKNRCLAQVAIIFSTHVSYTIGQHYITRLGTLYFIVIFYDLG